MIHYCCYCGEIIDKEAGDDEIIFENEYYHSPCLDSWFIDNSIEDEENKI